MSRMKLAEELFGIVLLLVACPAGASSVGVPQGNLGSGVGSAPMRVSFASRSVVQSEGINILAGHSSRGGVAGAAFGSSIGVRGVEEERVAAMGGSEVQLRFITRTSTLWPSKPLFRPYILQHDVVNPAPESSSAVLFGLGLMALVLAGGWHNRRLKYRG